jgi:putative oxidoreductase
MNTVAADSSRNAGRVRAFVRWALGAIFIGAGVLKVAHPTDFYASLLAYEVGAPDWFFRSVAVVFPWLEIFGGGLLLVDVWAETAGVLVAGMCLVFVLMLGQAVLRGLDLKCGCFGALDTGWLEQPLVALVRAGGLLAASVWLLVKPAHRRAGEALAINRP